MTPAERKSYAQTIFAQHPELFPEDRRQSILNGVVLIGMTPFEARLAGGAFAYKVVADKASVIDNTEAAKPEFPGTPAHKFLFGDVDANGTRIPTGVWDNVSGRFVDATVGEVRTLTSEAESKCVFGQTEVARALAQVRRALCAAAVFLCMYCATSGLAMAGSGFTEQGNALSKALKGHLVAQGICKDITACHEALQMTRADGDGRIHFMMYGQKDKALSGMIAGFLVANGLRITGGMPITFSVYEEPHSFYVYVAGDPNSSLYRAFMAGIGKTEKSIKLEINK